MNQAAEMLRLQVEKARGHLVDGAADLPDAIRPLWNDSLKAIDTAIKSIEPARTKVHKLWARNDFTIPARQEQSTALVRALDADVNALLDKAERLLSEIAHKLEEDIHPARPSDASEMAIWRRTDEVAAYLRRGNGSAAIITQLMGEAIRDHDDLTAYVLAGGPLDWVYRELGIDRPRLRSALFRAVREARLQPIAGEALLRSYEAPINDPNTGQENKECWQALRRDIANLVGTVASDAADGLRLTSMHSYGWGVPSEAERLQQQREAALSASTAGAVNNPELENFRRRQGITGYEPVSSVPGDLKPSLDLNAAK